MGCGDDSGRHEGRQTDKSCRVAKPRGNNLAAETDFFFAPPHAGVLGLGKAVECGKLACEAESLTNGPGQTGFTCSSGNANVGS